ncbi:MAG TPA: acetylxylan esterase [Pirellulales bacterium]|nr:acetylxylan esterase [Pirellulales bacterium]
MVALGVRRALVVLLLVMLPLTGAGTIWAAPPRGNTDEALVGQYTLPDPLRAADGTAVTTAADWIGRRRGEILALFTEQMFGHAPPAPRPDAIRFDILSEHDALDGLATRREIDVHLAENPPVRMTMLVYVPKSGRPAPCFWGLNFAGNQAVTDEPDVRINANWMDSSRPGVVDHRATEASRGSEASRWPVKLIVGRGYALATAYYGDIDPDHDDGFHNGIHAAFPSLEKSPRAADAWGSIAAWAWGMSRGLDYLAQDPAIDGKCVAAIGHSRLGKTSLWAGATDPRFALVVSNNSGCGGAALSKRNFGETVAAINHNFPHWFCGNFKRYDDNEAALPFDQHELLALIAPRPLYVASAAEDLWADPKGEFLACVAADPVYRLLGTDGMGGSAPPKEMPAVDQPLATGTIGYHIRTGKHDVTEFDWQQYLDFADRHWNRKKASHP